jgi:hypothetical protein
VRSLVLALVFVCSACEHSDMALPTSREETFTPASPVSSNTLNAIQDAIIGRKRPSFVRSVPFAALNIINGWTFTFGGTAYYESNASGSAYLALPMEVGERVTGIEVDVYGNGAADTTFTAYYMDAAQVPQQLATLTDTNRSAAWFSLAIAAFTAHTMAAKESLVLQIGQNAAGYRLGTFRYTVDLL